MNARNSSKVVPLRLAIGVTLLVAVVSSFVTYTIVKPGYSELDPRCDPVFIEHSMSGEKECDYAREQRYWLDLQKNPDDS